MAYGVDSGGGGAIAPPPFFSEFPEMISKIINFTHYFGVKWKRLVAFGTHPTKNYRAGSDMTCQTDMT